jgi:two-component system CheB/CheR fusion protein
MRKTGRTRIFPIVAIGASAGGLHAFEDLLAALPTAPGMAFILVPHLAPQYESHLTEILARSSKLPVSEVKSGDKVLPDRIYILPPDRALVIKNGVLYLHASGHKSDWRNPIDSFFRSLAKDRRQYATGVLLSGEGSDGTEGLRAIKENGGTTFAQDVKTATHLSMPQSAVTAGYVDFILSPSAIGKQMAIKHNLTKKPLPLTGEDVLNKILALLGNEKNVEFKLYKRNTLHRRVRRRMALLDINSPQDYLHRLQTDPGELELLYSNILISVTSFFREPESFRILKSVIYPRLLKKRTSDNAPLRIWIPGCSTGEEAYSHAMNLVEFLDAHRTKIPFQIFATDVKPAVIDHARAGLYPRKIKTELSPARLRRFFTETRDGYRISPAIRERCIFAAKNLLQDPPFTNLDLISCRNLLIYLGPELQEKAMIIFQYALKPRGILMLGRSETIGDFHGRFAPLGINRKVFYERTSASEKLLDFMQAGHFTGAAASALNGGHIAPGQDTARQDEFELKNALDGILPARYVPNGVIVNGDMEILRFSGNTSAYLRPVPGKPGMNLRRMASQELLLELRAAVHVAKKSACVVRKEIAAPHAKDPAERILLEVLPLKTSSVHAGCFFILFEDIETPSAAGGTRRAESRSVVELREDLAVSGENLKAIIEELETTNVKLKASNEELLSSNEELQSINEEFETAKEELQSTNEELVTSGEETVRTNQFLNRANNDLSNLLSNINIPIVLLGPDLAIRRCTPPAETVLNLSSGQTGRSILDIGLPLRLANLKALLLDVTQTGCTRNLEVQHAGGRWYYLIIRPYRPAGIKANKSRTDGAVMALVDITDRKLAEKTMLRLATLARDSNDAIVIRDLRDRIIAWNAGAQKMYGYTEEQALKMNIRQLVPGGKTRTKELVRMSLQGQRPVMLETQRLTRQGRILDVQLTTALLRDEKGQPVELATTERDITDKKLADRELRSLRARVISAQEAERKRLALELHDGVGQILTGIKFLLDSLSFKVSPGGTGRERVIKIGRLLDNAISEVRRVSQNLIPSELENLGLLPALRMTCREFKDNTAITVTLRVKDIPDKVPPELALAFFRITQEALNNIAKHAGATSAQVTLSGGNDRISLVIKDNGIGFAPGSKNALRGRGIGLNNMRERAESVGGGIRIHSARGTGTTLEMQAPLSGLEGRNHEKKATAQY